MLVKDLMTKNVIAVKPETSVSEVADLLHKHHFTGVPVVDGENKVLGVISERDFITSESKLYLPTYIKLLGEMDYIQGARKGLPYAVGQIIHATARDIMNQHIVFASPEMTLEQLADIFALKRVNPVPVTDAQNHLLGIISRSDLIKLFSGHQLAGEPEAEEGPHRAIDRQVSYVTRDFHSRFAYVAKARANIWLTSAVVLFVIGFVIGVVYVANPDIFTGPEPKLLQSPGRTYQTP